MFDNLSRKRRKKTKTDTNKTILSSIVYKQIVTTKNNTTKPHGRYQSICLSGDIRHPCISYSWIP